MNRMPFKRPETAQIRKDLQNHEKSEKIKIHPVSGDSKGIPDDGLKFNVWFRVGTRPVAKARPRHGKGKVFTTASTVIYEKTVAMFARRAMGRILPTKNPVRVKIEFFLKSRKRVDIDNLIKSLLDGCNRIVWLDDSQVVSLSAEKVLHATEEFVDVFVTDEGVSNGWI